MQVNRGEQRQRAAGRLCGALSAEKFCDQKQLLESAINFIAHVRSIMRSSFHLDYYFSVAQKNIFIAQRIFDVSYDFISGFFFLSLPVSAAAVMVSVIFVHYFSPFSARSLENGSKKANVSDD